jgi:FkbM family methyltransferase
MHALVTADMLEQLHISERRRVQITLSCRDSDALPKVPDAGLAGESELGAYQLMHDGTRVLLGGYHGTWMSAIIQGLRGHHEPQEELAFHEVLRHIPPGSTMIELGGFWAYYSLWFHRHVPGAVNYVVEPDPKHRAIGIKNFDLNGCQATFLPYASGETTDDTASFLTESGEHLETCPRLCVDDLLERHQIKQVAILHADIQGAELGMLRGARAAITQGRVRFVFLSTHHVSISGNPQTHQSCLNFICEQGGHILADFTPEEGFSGDGLIVASFDPADRTIAPFAISRNVDPELEFWRPIEPPAPPAPPQPARPNLLTRGIRKVWRLMGKLMGRAA